MAQLKPAIINNDDEKLNDEQKKIMKSLTAEDIKKLKDMFFVYRSTPHYLSHFVYTQAFSLFDKDNSGTISQDELLELMISLDPRMTRDEFLLMVKEYDTDGDGVINWTEFCILMKPAIDDLDYNEAESKLSEDDMKAAFNIADADSSGMIEKKELGALLASLGEALSNEDLDALFKEMDDDNSGGIDFEEFKRLMVVLNSVEDDDESSTSWEYEEASHSSYEYITDSEEEALVEEYEPDFDIIDALSAKEDKSDKIQKQKSVQFKM